MSKPEANLWEKSWAEFSPGTPNKLWKIFPDIYEREVVRFLMSNQYNTTRFNRALRYTSKEIGEYINVSRRKVDSVMKSLEGQGYIRKTVEQSGTARAEYILTLSVTTTLSPMSHEEVEKLVGTTCPQEDFSGHHMPTSGHHMPTSKNAACIKKTPNPRQTGANENDAKNMRPVHLNSIYNSYNSNTSSPPKNDQGRVKESPCTPTNIERMIIDTLNKETGKKFKASSRHNRDLIKARLNEGYVFEDFVHVIKVKTEEWKDVQGMDHLLRPSTLFSPKMESYLNQRFKGELKADMRSTGVSLDKSIKKEFLEQLSRSEPDYTKLSKQALECFHALHGWNSINAIPTFQLAQSIKAALDMIERKNRDADTRPKERRVLHLEKKEKTTHITGAQLKDSLKELGVKI
jgi:uncharacterized phage protein (TIGR02220 family)